MPQGSPIFKEKVADMAPTWSHVGHFFAQSVARLNEQRVVYVGSMLFFDFLAVLAPSWLHFGSILEVRGSILKVFGVHVSIFL